MQISLIVAFTQNRVIGKNNQMPWHLPRDLAWFKRNTLNKPVIMGRKTFESIGRPLPNRSNIVLSRQPFVYEGVQWADSLQTALEFCRAAEEVMIIGGGELFKQSLPLADKLYLTEIQTALEGDTFFPEIDLDQWKIAEEEIVPADEKNAYACRFMVLEKIR
ncbi:dihydrofolate reductase [Pasteurella testudinis DSM 23072]|uniref:Dihydrofolate reductase n=1 Tax=Pasteurella testudinis DSM 23072 TaxID=1122938 RepID=A0A1W1UQ28_9PAST|nr:type 3 dihydrofolate reductase [Pasteurella testudinis]SMB83166.1 dihydrofolate reductase [Pasteurella testudinis DSM 23072]SUB50816.1 dihydrofolate reductase [Pasteurella testudinis]